MKKKWLIAISLAIVFGLGSCTSVIVWMRRDDPPPNDEDLRLARLVIPDEENAFTYFEKAGGALSWPEAEWDKIEATPEGEKWDGAFVERLLKENKETLEHWEKGLACPQMQVPELTYDTELPYFAAWRKIAKLSRLRALYLANSGKGAGAIDEAMKNVLFGQKMQKSHGAVIHYYVGVAVKELGLSTFRNVLPETKLDPNALKSLGDRLLAFRADEEGMANAMRLEYAASCDAVDMAAAGGTPVGLELSFPLNLKTGFLLKPNRTKRMLAETHRLFIERIGKTYKEQKQGELPPMMRYAIDKSASKSKLLLSRNAVGIVIFQMVGPRVYYIKAPCQENVHIAAMRLLIAIKCYKMKTGKLPETLDALVPEYIDAVPADDFDGKPMRYSPEKKLIWSVGENLEDDGGDEDADIIFEIEF